MEDNIKKAVTVLNQGGIVIFPTDTVFGIGCRIDNADAVERLFKIRKRPLNKAVPVLVDSFKMAQEYLLPVDKAVKEHLMDLFWPGALTIVLPCKVSKISSLIRGGGKSLGVRIPDSNIVLSLIKGLGVPLLGPSANFHREKTPYTFNDLDQKLIKMVDFAIPGEIGSRQPSTVIDCGKKPWKILRQGSVVVSSSYLFSGMPRLKSQNILFIDSSNNKSISLLLETDGIKKDIKIENIKGSQVMLKTIDNLLYKNKLALKDLDAINVNTGPGSFTGIRVGMSVANALGFSLGIPVNGKKAGLLVEQVYK